MTKAQAVLDIIVGLWLIHALNMFVALLNVKNPSLVYKVLCMM